MDQSGSKIKGIKRGSTGLALKAGAWYVVSSFLLKAIAFITIPIFSRLLSKNDYGEFGNYANWQATLLILTSAELYHSLSRAYYDYKDGYDEYVSSVTVLTFVITASVYLLFLVSGAWIYNVVKIPPQFVHIMFFTLFCSASKTVFLARERTLYRYKMVAIISGIDTVVPTLISSVLVILAGEASKLSARIYGHYLPSSIIGLICACVLLTKGKTVRIEHWKYALKLSVPLLFHYLTISLLTSSNTIIARNFGSAELSAEVNMATSVIHILTILFQALSGALTTWMMDNLEQHRFQKIRKESRIYLLGVAVVSIGVIVFAPEVLTILGGTQYASAISLIPGLVLAAFIQTITTILTIVLTYDKNVSMIAVINGIVAVVSVAAKVLLFPVMGVQCLPMVNIVVCGILFFANYVLVVRAGYKDVVDIWKYVASIAFVLVGMIMSTVMYKYSMARYTAIAIGAVLVIIALYLYKDRVFGLMKRK